MLVYYGKYQKLLFIYLLIYLLSSFVRLVNYLLIVTYLLTYLPTYLHFSSGIFDGFCKVKRYSEHKTSRSSLYLKIIANLKVALFRGGENFGALKI